MKIRPYRLKHKPTGLYYVKKSYGRLSERGSVYSTSQHSLQHKCSVYITVSQELLEKYEDKLKAIEEADKLFSKPIVGPSHLTHWSMMCPVDQFEKEYLDECPNVTPKRIDIKASVEELRDMDSVLEQLDEIKENTSKDWILGPVRKAKNYITELRDLKKSQLAS